MQAASKPQAFFRDEWKDSDISLRGREMSACGAGIQPPPLPQYHLQHQETSFSAPKSSQRYSPQALRFSSALTQVSSSSRNVQLTTFQYCCQQAHQMIATLETLLQIDKILRFEFATRAGSSK
ncbi:hypothetical protein BST61_g9395 [Cercospora zeina]